MTPKAESLLKQHMNFCEDVLRRIASGETDEEKTNWLRENQFGLRQISFAKVNSEVFAEVTISGRACLHLLQTEKAGSWVFSARLAISAS